MKRIAIVGLITSISLSLTGCGTPLTIAASYGRTEEVRALLDKGEDIHAQPFSCADSMLSLTDADALSCATWGGHTETVKLLLDRGADVNSRDSKTNSYSALVYAACAGHTDTAKLLVERGADVDHAIARLETMPGRSIGCKSSNPVGLLTRIAKARQPAKQLNVNTIVQETHASIKSDIDELPPNKIKFTSSAYAVVVGIEDYRQKLPKANFAVNDAQTVSNYLTKVLGYPEENVVVLLGDRAGNVDLAKYFEKWLLNNVDPGGTVFVYYSGHGAPNPKNGDAYIVPYDGDPSFIEETGYSLQRLYTALAKLPAKQIVVALDSCFSGAGGRSVLANGARPIVIQTKAPVTVPAGLTVLSASSGEQISSTYDEKGHGLFTYFLLKGIKNEDVISPEGSLRVDDLYAYLKPQVERVARKQYNNEQTPQLFVSNK